MFITSQKIYYNIYIFNVNGKMFFNAKYKNTNIFQVYVWNCCRHFSKSEITHKGFLYIVYQSLEIPLFIYVKYIVQLSDIHSKLIL